MSEVRMNPEVKEMWLKALRSGEYQQTNGALCSIGGLGSYEYCCLGVLCDLHIKYTGEGQWEETLSKLLRRYVDTAGASSTSVTTRIVEQWAGVSAQAGYVLSVPMDMNDNGKSFNEIADWIGENL